MRLKRLEIGRLPGIEQPFSVDFEPQAVNVITGPNGSGKSSLVRAVRALLYPDSSPHWCELSADWEDADDRLSCQRLGQQTQWQRQGETVGAPRLPDADSVGAYLISSEDLLGLGQTEQHISSRLRTLLAGGYDLDALLQQGALSAPPRPQKLARELEQTRSRLAAKEREYAELDDEMARLSALEDELDATATAAGRLSACEDALALADALARRQAIESILIEEYPGGMDRLRGDELERLDQIDQELAARNQAQGLARRQLEQVRGELERAGAADPLALEALQSELAEQRNRLATLEQRLASVDERIEADQTALQAASRRLGAEAIVLDEVLQPDRLEAMERLVERLQSQREQIRGLTAELARVHVSSNLTGRSQDDLRDARQALRQWLEAANLSPLEGVLWGGLGLAGTLAAWRSLSQTGAAPELILLCLLAVGVPFALLGRFIWRWRDLGQSRERFLETDIEPPLGWTPEEVAARLERLDTELESATRHEVSQVRASEVREQLNSQRATLERYRQQLAEQAEKMGLSLDGRMETGFLLWCRQIQEVQQLDQRLATSEMEREQLERRLRGVREEARARLVQHGLEDEIEADARGLALAVHQLSPRIRQTAERHNQVKAQIQRIEELDEDIAQLQRRRDQLFESLGLKAGDSGGLNHKMERFDAWRELEQQRRELELEIKRLESRLGQEGDLLKRAREQQRDSLENLLARLRDKAERRDAINRQISEIHTRHGELIKRRELENLTWTQSGLEHQLGDELDKQLLAASARLLVDDVRQAHRSDNEPIALKRAAHWFDRFTRHRYALRFGQERFAALDQRLDQHRSLDALSTGTRVQLLLAVRLAWIEQAESDSVSLPVFMDEVLTTSDPDRYRAVVDCVQEMVREGRQMFYLTAQSDDALAWQEWAGDGPMPHRIDMATVRAGQVTPLDYRLPKAERAPVALPDPQGLAPLEWAEAAGIDAINPWAGHGQAHVFHLLHDRLDLCQRLIQLDLPRLAEVQGFIDSAAADSFLDDEEKALLGARLAAARAVISDWQQRHDRPVSDSDLQASGLISDHFLPRVVELNRSLNGHPRQLIEALENGEVSRFRSDTTEQVAQWLADQGYLNGNDSAERLSTAELSLMANLPVDQAGEIRAWLIGAMVDPLKPVD
ncbi:MAG: AAA family ATPase [Wenzhouxiangella sp.]